MTRAVTVLLQAIRGAGVFRFDELAGEYPDLPCPWCRTPTAENDMACPGCGRRFG